MRVVQKCDNISNMWLMSYVTIDTRVVEPWILRCSSFSHYQCILLSISIVWQFPCAKKWCPIISFWGLTKPGSGRVETEPIWRQSRLAHKTIWNRATTSGCTVHMYLLSAEVFSSWHISRLLHTSLTLSSSLQHTLIIDQILYSKTLAVLPLIIFPKPPRWRFTTPSSSPFWCWRWHSSSHWLCLYLIQSSERCSTLSQKVW